MPSQSKRPVLVLSVEEREFLEKLCGLRTCSRRASERAKILLLYSDGLEITAIARRACVTRPSAYKCIDKALAMGVEAGLKDMPHQPNRSSITLEAKAWVTSLACIQPKTLGLAAEVWSRQALADYVRTHAGEAGITAWQRRRRRRCSEYCRRTSCTQKR